MSPKRTFHQRIEAFSRVRRAVINATLRYRLAMFALVIGIAALLLLSGWLPSAVLDVVLTLGLSGALLFLLIRYFLRKQRFQGHLHEAFHMEELHGNLNSRLISALDFVEDTQPSDLQQVVIERAAEDLKLDYETQLDIVPRNYYRRRFLLLLILFLVLGLTPWFGFQRVISNIRHSFFLVSEYLFPVEYTVTPAYGQHVHRVGEEVLIELQFHGRRFPEVDVVRTAGDQTERQTIAVSQDGRAGWQVKGTVESEHTVVFEFGERVTGEVILVFAHAPVLENMQTELVYPAYTRMLPRSLEGLQQRLFGLTGTRITLGFSFSKDLASAVFTMDDGDDLPLEVTGRFATTSLVHSRSRQASLQVEDIHGLKMEYPFIIDFELQNDEPPEVTIPGSLKDEMPTLAEGLKLFGFGVRVQDDYGVSKCVLKWTKSTISNPTEITERGEIERIISPPRRQAVESFQKIFENLDVRPGDRISFFVEAYDNRSPDSQRAVSASKSLFVYQQELEDLNIASLHFGQGDVLRARIPKSKRATSVKDPMAMKTQEKVWNEYEADIDTATAPPLISGDYAQAVKDYLQLISTAVEADDAPVQESTDPGLPSESVPGE